LNSRRKTDLRIFDVVISQRWLVSTVVVLYLASVACEDKSQFDEAKAKATIEAAPVTLDSEQVTIVPKQIDCGVQSELWESPAQISGERSTARLTPQGAALHFSEDPTLDTDFHQPYAQVRGAFQLSVDRISGIRDGEEGHTKLVDAKVGIKIPHDCFQDPLPIMGVKHRNFREDTPATFLFRFADNDWHLEKLVH
jgi:hypothetical protein